MNDDRTFSERTKTVLIQGETFRVKEQLKALGGYWDAIMRGWRVPEAAAAEARNLVENQVGQLSFDESDPS